MNCKKVVNQCVGSLIVPPKQCRMYTLRIIDPINLHNSAHGTSYVRCYVCLSNHSCSNFLQIEICRCNNSGTDRFSKGVDVQPRKTPSSFLRRLTLLAVVWNCAAIMLSLFPSSIQSWVRSSLVRSSMRLSDTVEFCPYYYRCVNSADNARCFHKSSRLTALISTRPSVCQKSGFIPEENQDRP